MSTYKVPELNTFEFQKPVLDKDLTSPPAEPNKGNRYIVAAEATGDWSGQDNNIATYNGEGWDFTSAREGMLIYVKDEDEFYIYITSWITFTSVYNNLYLQKSNNLSDLNSAAIARKNLGIKGNLCFGIGKPRVLNLASTDADLKGFMGGFTDGRYGYFVPFHNGAAFGKVARVDLNDFSTVSVLNLASTDADLKGFIGGFTDGRYGYFVPHHNGAQFGKVARVDLNDFSTVSVLNLASTDADLKGFVGGFTDGRYGYFVPYSNGAAFGKVARVYMNFGGNL